MAITNRHGASPRVAPPASTIRRPAVSGYFYPAEAPVLRRTIEAIAPRRRSLRRKAHAAIVPHGSYIRCGAVMGSVLAHIAVPRRCVIVGPSHAGNWMPWSLLGTGIYRTPLGDVPVDGQLAQALRSACAFLPAEDWPQEGEHAIEVVVPFLQHLGPEDLSLVPVLAGSDDAVELRRFGAALAQVVRQAGEPVLLIASTDLTHFLPLEQAIAADEQLIGHLCALEEDALIHEAVDGGRSMCGYGAAASVIFAARALGARQGTLTRYATSADSDGDPGSVIGYAGIMID